MRNVVVLLLVIVSLTQLSAQNTKDTLRVLFIGNSYTFYHNVPYLVSEISNQTDTKIIAKKSTAGGASLSDHWRGERKLKTVDILKNGNFDIVVLHDQSMRPIEEPDSFFYYSKLFSDLIKESGAKPYFFGTWAREKVPQWQQVLTENYKKAASGNNAEIVQVGEAWALAKKYRPAVELYASDGSHASSLGALLTALVFVNALTGQVPEKLSNKIYIKSADGESILIMNESKLDVDFCLEIAKELNNNMLVDDKLNKGKTIKL